MPYREGPPPAALRGLVVCTWVNEVSPGDPTRVLPDGCVDVMWRTPGPGGGDGELIVAGPDTTAQHITVDGPVRYVGVRFRPGAAAVGLGLPASALRDGRVPLEHVWGAAVADRMADHLAEAPAPGQALAAAVVDRLASAGATEADLPGPGLAAALRAEQGPGGVRQVARTLGVTERQLHRRCVTHFGYGPKTVQRVLRFQDALAMARRDRPLAIVAAEAGYADQAHLARDVRALAGATLTELLAGR